MGLRSWVLRGSAYADSGQVTVSMDIDGVEVFNGVVPTINTAVPNLGLLAITDLLTFQKDHFWWPATSIPCTISVTGGTLGFSTLACDKIAGTDWVTVNDVTRPDTETPRVKTNITLDGVLINAADPTDGWHYTIPAGSTMTLDWNFPGQKKGVPGKTL